MISLTFLSAIIIIGSILDQVSANPIAPLLENADITEGAYRDLDCQIEVAINKNIPSYLSGSLYRAGPAYWDPSLNLHENNTHSHLFFGLGMVHVFHFNQYHTNNKISYRGEFQESGGYESFFDGKTSFWKLLSANNQITIRRLTESDGTHTLLVGGGYTFSNSFDPETVKIDQTPYHFTDHRARWPLFNYKTSFGHSPAHEQVDVDGTMFNYIDVIDETILGKPRGYYQSYHVKPGTTERIFAKNKIYPNPVGGGQPLYTHSMGLTEHYLIICEIPYKMTADIDLSKLTDLSNMKTTFEYLGDNGVLNYVTWYVVDKYTGKLHGKFISDLFIYYHFGNSYEHIDEEGNTQIIVDLVIYDSEDKSNIDAFDAAYLANILNPNNNHIATDCNARYARFVLPMNQGINSRIGYQELSEFKGVEFPLYSYEKYNTKQYEYAYLGGYEHCNNDDTATVVSRLTDTLIKQRLPIYPSTTRYDPVTYSKANHYFQEPVFVPDPNGVDEDDGIVLSLVFDSVNNRSYLLILDAKKFEEIATITPNLARAIPVTLHGRYYQQMMNAF